MIAQRFACPLEGVEHATVGGVAYCVDGGGDARLRCCDDSVL